MRFLFSIYFFVMLTELQAKQTICLNMIVKNEAHVITRCLESVKHLIDYWVIVDTGSSDHTQEIVRGYLQDIPGFLCELPWEDWGTTRTKALRLAQNHSDYILFMDADDVLEFEEDFDLENLIEDQYNMWRGSRSFSYLKPQLVKSNLPWKWEGVTHEFLSCPVPFTQAIIEKVRYQCMDDGSSRQDREKFKKNIDLLEKGLKQDPLNTRYMFYLGESYRDHGDPAKALEWYQKRVEAGGWEEEVFYAKLQIAQCLKRLNLPLRVQLAAYKDCYEYRSSRIEPIYYIAEIYNLEMNYEKAYELLEEVNLQTFKKDALFNENWILDYGLHFQHSICSYYVGMYQQSLDLCNTLLENSNLPESWRELVLKNREFPIKKLKEQ